MEYNDLEDLIREQEASLSSAFPALMRKVYTWMALALAITGLTAYFVSHSPTLLSLIFGNQIVFWGLIIAELALVFTVSAAINKLSLTTATLLFILYAVLNGATLSSIFMVYKISVIGKVFFITAGTFAIMAWWGYSTKRDLSSMGKLMFMALIGIIIASIVNFFTKSPTLDYILSYLGVAIFVGLTAWDSQKIKMMLASCPDADEQAQKIALNGALALYLDFINLFLYLLRIFGREK